MSDPGDEKRRQETFTSATASALRAISRLKGLDIQYSAAMRHGDSRAEPPTVTLPQPDACDTPESRTMLRASADVKALRLRGHNRTAHARLAPSDPEARAVFDAMEQARWEAAGSAHMEGVRDNLDALLAARFESLGYDKISGKDAIPAPEALHALTRLALTGRAPPPSVRKACAYWEPALAEALGAEGLTTLNCHIHDQRAFARAARTVLGRLGFNAGGESEGEDGRDEGESASESGEAPPAQGDDTNAADTGERERLQSEADRPATDEETLQALELDESMLEDAQGPDTQDIDAPGAPPVQRPEGFEGGEGLYKVYTTQFDETVRADELADHTELYQLREQLDRQLTHIQGIITRLANKLQRQLMARQQRSWQFDLEEGVLDTARLPRVVANPNVSLTYKQEQETNFRDTIVTLLIDNSGSMRGRPITIAALCTDILARTLERAGVKVEILGFTTSAWKGGKSRELWFENERPPKPGRLNDLRHIIYKAADAPWRRTRKNLGLMLKEGVLKENIDGEALAWAYNRLVRRPEQRKILMVISDGAPVDDSTLSVNPSHILEQDLKNIIQWIENTSKVELTAIGIGHDVTRYYRKAMTITDADALGQALTDQLTDLFELPRTVTFRAQK
ncbi:MAG: cobaltochelatase subunit CobT [Alphaproteobacteria bacterium]|nr:cobaltochelatase subunit CobT [Alphaproteobacteria bacterium]